MGNDDFSKTEVGLHYDDVLDLCLDLMVFKESLAICVYNKEDSTFKLEIWTINEAERVLAEAIHMVMFPSPNYDHVPFG